MRNFGTPLFPKILIREGRFGCSRSLPALKPFLTKNGLKAGKEFEHLTRSSRMRVFINRDECEPYAVRMKKSMKDDSAHMINHQFRVNKIAPLLVASRISWLSLNSKNRFFFIVFLCARSARKFFEKGRICSENYSKTQEICSKISSFLKERCEVAANLSFWCLFRDEPKIKHASFNRRRQTIVHFWYFFVLRPKEKEKNKRRKR